MHVVGICNSHSRDICMHINNINRPYSEKLKITHKQNNTFAQNYKIKVYINILVFY